MMMWSWALNDGLTFHAEVHRALHAAHLFITLDLGLGALRRARTGAVPPPPRQPADPPMPAIRLFSPHARRAATPPHAPAPALRPPVPRTCRENSRPAPSADGWSVHVAGTDAVPPQLLSFCR